MSKPVSFVERLVDVIKPTPLQVLLAMVVAIVLLAGAQTKELLPRIGISSEAITVSSDKFHDRFDAVLRSPIASNMALMVFWAMVGLVAYLICWGCYNVLIEARNEVTLNTAYTNRGHWHGPWETLAVKAVAGVGLAVLLSTFWSLVSFWVALSSSAVNEPSGTTFAFAVIAAVGFAAHLYSVLLFIQLTFTPWYRAESFTEA